MNRPMYSLMVTMGVNCGVESEEEAERGREDHFVGERPPATKSPTVLIMNGPT